MEYKKMTTFTTDDRLAAQAIDYDEKGVNSIHTPGGIQEMTTVNEPGLYALVLGSRKAEAKCFKRWVTHEVLPAIRKIGSYAVPTMAALRMTIKPGGHDDAAQGWTGGYASSLLHLFD